MTEFKGKLGTYKVVLTSDQSPTLWSEAFDENCHSVAGAKQETQYIYIEGCELLEKSKKGSINILEVGFGAGQGLKETYEFFKMKAPHCQVHYYSLELDEGLIPWAFENLIHFPMPQNKGSFFQGKVDQFEYSILIGDARKVVPNFPLPKVNAIFQDAFSPDKNPTLWTIEWFELLKSISAADVILTTYSASSKVKKGLFEAGWSVSERLGFSGKRGSIKADLSGKMDSRIIEKLERSPAQALRD